MLLYGASGHARVICGIIEDLGLEIKGLFDDYSSESYMDKYKILGRYTRNNYPNDKLIISIGDNQLRRNLVKKIQHTFGIAIHPKAVIDRLTNVQEGTVVMANALINRGTHIGKHCIINSSCSIDHDCKVDDFVHIAPNATLCGGVIVKEGTLIGAGATIIQNIHIGQNVIIGAGAVIVENVPDNAVVVGSPGKIIRFINVK